MSQTKKAESLMRLLKQNLQLRLAAAYPAMTFAESADSNGNPVLSIVDGTWATTKAAAIVRIKSLSTAFVNSINMPQEVFTPHSIESSMEGNSATPTNVACSANFSKVLDLEINRLGMLSRSVIVPVTTQPAVAQLDTVPANSFDKTFAPDVMWPLSGQ
jgi:hypothetical protein